MNVAPRSTPLWFRLSALGLGTLLLFWLPVEDLDVRWVIIFGAAISALVAALYLFKNIPSKPDLIQGENPPGSGQQARTADRSWPVFALTGALAGLAVPLLAALLMILKIGLHGHPTPDFTPGQILAVFHRTPIFVVAGLFIGSGIWIYRKTVSSSDRR